MASTNANRATGDGAVPKVSCLPQEELPSNSQLDSATQASRRTLTGPLLEPDYKPCEQCSQQFEPRKGSGGKPQRFCSTDCRQSFHSEERRNENNREAAPYLKPQRGQRAPTCTLPAVIPKPPLAKEETRPQEAEKDLEAFKRGFDWSEDDAVVLKHQPAVAVYWNNAGGLTIRQERDWNEEEDSIIAITKENLDQFLDKLTDICGIPSVGKSR